MIPLSANNFHIVLPLLKPVNFNHEFVKSVINGDASGKIYVDNPTNPQTFYIFHSYGMSLLLGNEHNNVFNNWLTTYLLTNNDNKTQIEWMQVYPESWNNKLADLFKQKLIRKKKVEEINKIGQPLGKIIENTRVNFEFNRAKYLEFNKSGPETKFQIITTTKEHFRKIEGTVVPKAFWKSEEIFDEKGIAFSIVIDNDPISTAFAAFIHGNQLEIGIETQKTHQGKGLAIEACCKLIDYCLAENLIPIWSCRFENTGSFLLAQKLGFVPVSYFPYYMINHL